MGKTIRFNNEQLAAIQKCVGGVCTTPAEYKEAILNELKKNVVPNKTEATKEKVKGKIRHRKPMSVDHPTPDISSIVRQEVEKVTKGIQQTQTTQEDPHKDDKSHMPKGVNFIHCKNCGKMENPKGITTKYKGCPDCGANTVHPDYEVCPYCGNKADEWEDGIELEDEQ